MESTEACSYLDQMMEPCCHFVLFVVPSAPEGGIDSVVRSNFAQHGLKLGVKTFLNQRNHMCLRNTPKRSVTEAFEVQFASRSSKLAALPVTP